MLMSYQQKKILALTIIGIAVCALAWFHINSRDGVYFFNHTVKTFNEGWTVGYTGEQIDNVTLPVDLDLQGSDNFFAQRILPDNLDNHAALLLRASMQDVDVYIDDVKIFSNHDDRLKPANYVYASMWNIIDLEATYSNKQIRIEYQTPISVFSGKIYQIKCGTKEDLLLDLIRREYLGFFSSIVLIATGLLALILAYMQDKSDGYRLLYLGIVGVAMGIWILSEATLMQFMTDSRVIIGSISYVAIPVITCSLIMYVRETIIIEENNKRQSFYLFLANFMVLIAILLLQISGVSKFIESMRVAFFVIITTIGYGIYLMIKELIQLNNQVVKKTFKYIVILGISVTSEIVMFYLELYSFTSHVLRIGIIIFFAVLVVEYYQYYITTLADKKEKELLKKWAYKDLLINGNNRNAFERDTNQLLQEKEPFRLVLADINNLKIINDNYGHQIGDKVIKWVYQKLEQTYQKDGICYRIGGDELAVIILDIHPELAMHRQREFEQALQVQSIHLPVMINVAIASDVYDRDTWSEFTDFYHHVDIEMYKDKSQKKQLEQVQVF